MGWKCGMCVHETLVCASACEHFTWHRQHSGKASRSVCINRYSAHADQCLDRRQRASAPECQTLLSVLALLFPSVSLFPLRPRPTLLSAFSLLFSLLPPHAFFSSFPSVTPHLFSPPASHPSAIAPRSGQLFNTSPPRQEGLVPCFFCPPEEIQRSKPLSSMHFNLYKSEAEKGQIWQHSRNHLNPVVSDDVAHSPGHPHTTKGLHTLTHPQTHTPTEHMGFLHGLPHVPPLSGQACSERPSDGLPVLVLLIDAMSDYTFTPCTGGC